MCGIAGFVALSKPGFDAAATARAMADALAHRGPNDAGAAAWDFGRGVAALGHRRLTIIDLSAAGRQPMEDEGLAISYNGEIYNYLELRRELEGFGHEFRSASDTEVVLKAYRQWGEQCFARFNGMWALALLDRRANALWLSRDRFGKKPLYYARVGSARDGDALVFGSEPKALPRFPGFQAKPDFAKVFRYAAWNYRYVDVDDGSFFEGVRQVPAATSLRWDAELRERAVRYWELRPPERPLALPDAEAVARFRELLVDSVRLRLRSDVPVGCMLSGGLDSTSITCIAYKVLKQPIETYSGVTGGVKGVYDESEHIDAVVAETGAKHHYVRPDPADLFSTVAEMLGFHDEPICTVTWYSLYLIARQIKNAGTPVVLNGHGGDELLAGYWDYYHYNLADMEPGPERDAEIAAWTRNHGRDPAELARYEDYIARLSDGRADEMARFPDYSDCLELRAPRPHLDNPFVGRGWLLRRQYSDLFYEAIPPALRPEDRNTMAHSIESRSPFLDYRLAEFCFALPNRQKIRGGVGKWLLREAMKGLLPEKVRARKDKAGFIAPADEWFRGVGQAGLVDIVGSPSLRERGLYRLEEVWRVLREHRLGERDHQMFLWRLINLELWMRRFFDAPVAAKT